MKVYVERQNQKVGEMFIKRGWEVTSKVDEAQLVCFTGGADVSPMLYGVGKHPKTNSNPALDEAGNELYHDCLYQIPMVGICRGGQFLNIMNGGEAFQHVDGHALKGSSTHSAINVMSGETVQVSSTHHQMMIPVLEEAEVLLTAHISKERQFSGNFKSPIKEDMPDIEVCWYPSSNSLCFQPHPEYLPSNHPCQNLFFSWLREYLF